MNEYVQDLPLWNDPQAFEILEELCKKHQVPVDVFRELVAEQRKNQHRERARGISERFEEIFNNID
ncbi:MAG: DNA modification system-associated small protein [Candidatus Methylumidiphilus sp.]